MRIQINTDGGSRGNPGPSAAAAVLVDNDSREHLETVSEFLPVATNNEAEYAALILGAKTALKYNPTFVCVFSDSDLMVKQVKGTWIAKDSRMKELCSRARAALSEFPRWAIIYIPREQNVAADVEANNCMDAHAHVVVDPSSHPVSKRARAQAVMF